MQIWEAPRICLHLYFYHQIFRHGPSPWLRAKLIQSGRTWYWYSCWTGSYIVFVCSGNSKIEITCDREQLMPGFHHWIPSGRSPYHFGSNKRISPIRSKDARTQNLIPEHVGNQSLLWHDFHSSRISTILLGFSIWVYIAVLYTADLIYLFAFWILPCMLGFG